MRKSAKLLHKCFWFVGLLLFGSLTLAAQTTSISQDLTNWSSSDSRPGWLKIKPELFIDNQEFMKILAPKARSNNQKEFKLQEVKKDELGLTRYIYQQSFQGIPIESTPLILHEQLGKIFLAQGLYKTKLPTQSKTPNLSEDQALKKVLAIHAAQQYAWESPSLERQLQLSKNDPNATYYPKGALVWTQQEETDQLVLVYQFDVYSIQPTSKKRYFINAHTGQLIRSLNRLYNTCFEHETPPNCPTTTSSFNFYFDHTTNESAGSGRANYIQANEGMVNLITGYDGNAYNLITKDLGPKGNQEIHTMNANNQWDYSQLTEFVDEDNIWENQMEAIGAHWGTAKVYDYYMDVHNRDSYDGLGSPLFNVVHYGTDYANAFWDGIQMTYGDGDGYSWDALTSLDIIAHEITHGVTEHNGTGGLNYINESGALNESFSDIFGAVIEFKMHPDGGDWYIGEDFDLMHEKGFRSLSNPLAMGQPQTYLGTDWFDDIGDYGGVHTNSGVQNFWFYLIVEGGTGINEFGNSYAINPIGVEKAAAIAYRNLTNYLTPNATFEDARAGSILAAIQLFGEHSVEHQSVEAAWCAVGVGEGCSPKIQVSEPVADELLIAGTNFLIKWNTSLLSASTVLKIEYTTENGANAKWHLIERGVANTGTYNWYVPSVYSNTVRVRVTDDGDESIGRQGLDDIFGQNDLFRIESCTGTQSFEGPKMAMRQEPVLFTGNITGESYTWRIDGQTVASSQNLSYTFPNPGVYEITYVVANAEKACYNEETKRMYVLAENSNAFNLKIGNVNNSGESAYSQEILTTKDRGYIFISIFSSKVFKIDAVGNIQWESGMLPNPHASNYQTMATEQENGNILVLFNTPEAETTNGQEQLLLIELDGNSGAVLNSMGKQITANGRLFPQDIQTTEKGYLIGGEIESNSLKDIFILELNKEDLSVQNLAILGDANSHDYFRSLTPTAMGGYMLGFLQDSGYPNQHFAVAKLNENFDEIWTSGLYAYLPGPYPGSRMSVFEIPNCGGYMVLASRDEFSNSYLIKLNVLGSIEWAKRYVSPGDLDQYPISFQKMVWDGEKGLTLLGVVTTQYTPYGYAANVEYQLMNINFAGEINWQRKIDDLKLAGPSSVTYPLYQAKLLRTPDGGYFANLPADDLGNGTYLIKTDKLGLDGCSIENANAYSEDITASFLVNRDLNIKSELAIIFGEGADYSLPRVDIVTPSSSICGSIAGNPIIAAFQANKYQIGVGEAPIINNQSNGATTFHWYLDGQLVNLPLEPFSSGGVYKLLLVATNGTHSSWVQHDLVVAEEECTIPCDLAYDFSYFYSETCPGAQDGFINSAVQSDRGRSFVYDLYNGAQELIKTQKEGYFPNLKPGKYQIMARTDDDASCSMEVGKFHLEAIVDALPPIAVCLDKTVNAAIVHGATGFPWNAYQYALELTEVYGNNWHELSYETLNETLLFSTNYNFIYLEGSGDSANELETFLNNNHQLVEDWVAKGNTLLLNAAPSQGDGMNFGFGGVQLNYNIYSSDGEVASQTHPIFNGSMESMGRSFTGSPFGYAVLCPGHLPATPLLQNAAGEDLLVEAQWGEGRVVFGGLTPISFHQPFEDAFHLKVNLLNYLKSQAMIAENKPLTLNLDSNKEVLLDVRMLDVGAFDGCQLASVVADKLVFNCNEIGLNTVTLIVEDAAQNQATCKAEFEIIDPFNNCVRNTDGFYPETSVLVDLNKSEKTKTDRKFEISKDGWTQLTSAEDIINYYNKVALEGRENVNELAIKPNPFKESTTIDFQIGIPQQVKLAVYSMDGKLLSVLKEGYLDKGKYSNSFQAIHYKGGMYVVILQTETEWLTQKLILVK